MHIGEQIKTLYKKKFSTVQSFADAIGRSHREVYNIFKKKQLKPELLDLICSVLEIDAAELHRMNYSHEYEEKGSSVNKDMNKYEVPSDRITLTFRDYESLIQAQNEAIRRENEAIRKENEALRKTNELLAKIAELEGTLKNQAETKNSGASPSQNSRLIAIINDFFINDHKLN
jgi:hypothetical protein